MKKYFSENQRDIQNNFWAGVDAAHLLMAPAAGSGSWLSPETGEDPAESSCRIIPETGENSLPKYIMANLVAFHSLLQKNLAMGFIVG